MSDTHDGGASSAPDFFSSLPLIDALMSAVEAAVSASEHLLAAYLAFQLSRLLHKFHWMQFAIAYDDLAVDVLEALPETSDASMREFRLTVLRQTGLDHLLLGHLDLASESFEAAQQLLDDTIAPDLRAALAWDASVLAQWRNDPLLGLNLASQAWEYCQFHDPPIERQRLHLHISQLAMDVACVNTPLINSVVSPEASEYLMLAKEHLDQARPEPDLPFAPEVEISFLLAYARYSRLTDLPEDRISLLEYAVQQASKLHRAAEGQALTALGDELLALGDIKEARNRYQQAIEVFSSSLAPGLALLPRRALARLDEFRDD